MREAIVFFPPFITKWMKRVMKVRQYLRYADDFAIFSPDRERLVQLVDPMRDFLESTLKLHIHEDKIVLKTIFSGVDFLGWVHFPDHRVLRTTSKKRMFTRLRRTSKTESLQSYLGLLSHGNAQRLTRRIKNFAPSRQTIDRYIG